MIYIDVVNAINIFYQVKGDGTPAFNLLTCIDKMLCIGMSFENAINATTRRPAELLGLQDEIGTLKPGAYADIAGFTIEQGDIELIDIHGVVRHGKESVKNVFTILDGKEFPPMEIPPSPPWIEILGR